MMYFLDVCTDSSFLSVISLAKGIIEIICIIVPILLILMSSIDVGKIVLNPDSKEVKKATSMLIKRFIGAIGVFFIPTIVSVVFGLVGTVNYKTTACWNNANKITIQTYRAAEKAKKEAEQNKLDNQKEREEALNSTQGASALAIKMIKIAQREADSHPSDSPNKYTRGFGKINGYPADGYDYPWCAAFVWWVSNEAGVYPVEVGKKTAGVRGYKNYFQSGKNGVRYEVSQAHGGTYVPKMGDYIFFDWQNDPTGADHIGLVKGVSGNSVLIIDGNYSNTVKDRAKYLSSKDIIGYGVWE